jgi:hypothetical protein
LLVLNDVRAFEWKMKIIFPFFWNAMDSFISNKSPIYTYIFSYLCTRIIYLAIHDGSCLNRHLPLFFPIYMPKPQYNDLHHLLSMHILYAYRGLIYNLCDNSVNKSTLFLYSLMFFVIIYLEIFWMNFPTNLLYSATNSINLH